MKKRKDDAYARILRAGGDPEALDKILQDECRRRAARKLAATLLCAPGFRFPTALSAEQCTSDALAEFHASLIGDGARVTDLTAGLGIDAFHLARKAERVVAMDLDPKVAQALGENAKALGLSNFEAHCGDCREWLAEYDGPRLDVAFIDPARRDDAGGRLYSLTQCRPDVTEMLPAISRVARRLLVKASPMLDISQTLRELPGTRRAYCIGTRNECKELLLDIEFGYEGPAEIVAATVGEETRLTVMAADFDGRFAEGLEVGDRIGEPWPAVMKALSAGHIAGERLARSTALYRNPADDFPGEVYTVERIEEFSSSTVRRLAREGVDASVATRNFPLSADELRKRLKARENSRKRLIATTLSDGRQILAFLTPNVKKNA